MFYHVVLMRLTEADDAFLARVSDYAERIRRELPYVRDYQFGRTADHDRSIRYRPCTSR